MINYVPKTSNDRLFPALDEPETTDCSFRRSFVLFSVSPETVSVCVSHRCGRFRAEMAALICSTLEYFPENVLIDILSYLNVRELVRNSRYGVASRATDTMHP